MNRSEIGSKQGKNNKTLLGKSFACKPKEEHLKENRTIDFPSKDEEILYSIINKEFQTLFHLTSPKSTTQNKDLPNIEEYLSSVKDFRKVNFFKKTENIKTQCKELSKKFEQNLKLLKFNLEQKKLGASVENKEQNAIKKIQHTWRKYKQNSKKSQKNGVNICNSSLYQKNRAKLLENKNGELDFKKKKVLQKKNTEKKRVFKVENLKLKLDSKKLMNFSSQINRNGNIDSFSSSKQKHSFNTTLNFREINENSKSLITVHDFNSKSIDREDLSKITSSIHETLNKNFLKSEDINKDSSQEPFKKEGNYEKINEESPEISVNNSQFQKNTISSNLMGLIELSSKYQEELDLIKEKYLNKLSNLEVNQSAEKFFSLMRKQCELNKQILLENFKLSKAISNNDNLKPNLTLDSPFQLPISSSNPNDLKTSLKSNLSGLRAAFGSEKLIQEASLSINGTQPLTPQSHIFEEDSFRKFTNKKIIDFLRREGSLKEVLNLRDRPFQSKKKPKSCDFFQKNEKKGFKPEKWVEELKKPSKTPWRFSNRRRNFLGVELPKTQRDKALLESFSSARKGVQVDSYREFKSERIIRKEASRNLERKKRSLSKRKKSPKEPIESKLKTEVPESGGFYTTAVILPSGQNPFARDLIDEFKPQSELDIASAEEISIWLMDEIMKQAFSGLLGEKQCVANKIRRVFLPQEEEDLKEKHHRILFEGPEEIKGGHINEALKIMHNSLALLIIGDWQQDILDSFNDKADWIDFMRLRYYAWENDGEDMNLFLYMKENGPLKQIHLQRFFDEASKLFPGINQELLEINAFLVFDGVNEKLTVQKYQKRQATFTGSDLVMFLQKEKQLFGELIEDFCGVLEDNPMFSDLSPDENKEEVIIQIRELNMFKVLQEELFEIDKEWTDYEREKNQIKTEVSEMILDGCVEEIVGFLLAH